MENLSVNQRQVLAHLNANHEQLFSLTQIGVSVGKKLPKQASTWAKPIVEKLKEDGFIIEEKVGDNTKYRISAKIEDSELEVKEDKPKKEKVAKPTPKKEKVAKEPKPKKEKEDKPKKEKVAKEPKPKKLPLTPEEKAAKKAEQEERRVKVDQNLVDIVVGKMKEIAADESLSVVKDKKTHGEVFVAIYDTVIDGVEMPSEQSGLVLKAVKDVFKYVRKSAPKKASNSERQNIFTKNGVDLGVIKDAMLEKINDDITERSRKRKEDEEPYSPIKAVVLRDVANNILLEQYKFTETNIKDKRVRGKIHQMIRELAPELISERSVEFESEQIFEKGDKVKFIAHSSNKKGVVGENVGTVSKVFYNDFGFRYIVIKVEGVKSSFTSRDLNVELIEKVSKE